MYAERKKKQCNLNKLKRKEIFVETIEVIKNMIAEKIRLYWRISLTQYMYKQNFDYVDEK